MAAFADYLRGFGLGGGQKKAVVYRPSPKRRRNFADPLCRWASLSRRLAVFSLPVIVFGIVLLRSGFVAIAPGLSILSAGLALCGFSVLFALGSFVMIWNSGQRGFARALGALLLSCALLAGPGFIILRGLSQPRINDVTTDFTDIPGLEMASKLRPSGSNGTLYQGIKFALQQREFYPQVVPLEVALPLEETYKIVEKIVAKKGWKVLAVKPPAPKKREGVIEAVASTLVLGFQDDVVIRLRPGQHGTRIDMRSASRYGVHDFGVNSARIISFMEAVEKIVLGRK